MPRCETAASGLEKTVLSGEIIFAHNIRAEYLTTLLDIFTLLNQLIRTIGVHFLATINYNKYED